MVKRKFFRTAGLAAVAAFSLVFAGCGGGGGGATPPAPPVQPAPSNPPPTQSADACPTTGSTASGAARATAAVGSRAVPEISGAPRYVPGLIVVTDASGAMHVRSVDPSRVDDELARLRTQSDVRAVQRAQYRRVFSAPNDPYYAGFGPGAPYYESATVPGQWDMHVIGLGTGWTTVQRGAPIAIIDTGVDVTHPDLAGKIAYARCYVTYPTSAPQTTGPYVTDMDGHGTDVAGIAAADTNNAYGFVGAGFNAPILAFRIFPTPPSAGCSSSSKSPQCDTTDVDEVSAINDAVAHGARVINLSLGSDGPLSNCNDTIERNAIENAIAHGVVVVAAAGNEAANHLDCPAAYPGVVAVGASALEGSGNSVSEGVAGYSNYVGASGPGSGGAFLVAPGGDPPSTETCSGCTVDDLHWIENIYSSTAVQPGACNTDIAGEKGDCRIFIAGTSQATPHVAGVVSLMLAKNPSLTPAQVAAGLCASADSISDAKQGCGRVNAASAVTWAATH